MALERRKPLRRDGPGARRFAEQRSSLRRTDRLKARSPKPRQRANPKATTTPNDIPPESRAAVAARSGGLCEVRASSRCLDVASHMHHRKLRRHRDHRPVNLLHVCAVCHDAIHGHLAALGRSYRNGWLLHSWEDPEEHLPTGT